MGREVKRVALDFNWPIGKVWEGYKNPHYTACAECKGNGLAESARALDRLVSLLMIAGGDSLQPDRPPHHWLGEAGISSVGTTLHELTEGLSGQVLRGSITRHTSIDEWRAMNKIIKAAGLPREWCRCPRCNGTGEDPDTKEASAAWKPADLPEGEGWQMWETCSEGSPISPVFKAPEELARWLVDTEASAFGPCVATYEQWLAMIRRGWAPGMVHDEKGARPGVEFVGEKERAT